MQGRLMKLSNRERNWQAQNFDDFDSWLLRRVYTWQSFFCADDLCRYFEQSCKFVKSFPANNFWNSEIFVNPIKLWVLCVKVPNLKHVMPCPQNCKIFGGRLDRGKIFQNYWKLSRKHIKKSLAKKSENSFHSERTLKPEPTNQLRSEIVNEKIFFFLPRYSVREVPL